MSLARSLTTTQHDRSSRSPPHLQACASSDCVEGPTGVTSASAGGAYPPPPACSAVSSSVSCPYGAVGSAATVAFLGVTPSAPVVTQALPRPSAGWPPFVCVSFQATCAKWSPALFRATPPGLPPAASPPPPPQEAVCPGDGSTTPPGGLVTVYSYVPLSNCSAFVAGALSGFSRDVANPQVCSAGYCLQGPTGVVAAASPPPAPPQPSPPPPPVRPPPPGPPPSSASPLRAGVVAPLASVLLALAAAGSRAATPLE